MAGAGGAAERGESITEGSAVSNVVPTPAASARKARSWARTASRSTKESSAGRKAGRSPFSAATATAPLRSRTRPAPYRSAAFSPAAGSSGTTNAPSPASSAPATSSSVTTVTSATCGHASAAATVSSANASASAGRSAPTAAASLLLATASGFNGTTSDHATPVTSTSPLWTGAPLISRSGFTGAPERRTPGGVPSSLAATPARRPANEEESGCPAAESVSGTAWRPSSRSRRSLCCSSGIGAEWRTFRPRADSSRR